MRLRVLLRLLALQTARASSWSQRHPKEFAAALAKVKPPPPPPMDKWSTAFISTEAGRVGMNMSTFTEHDIDGAALHEMGHEYAVTHAVPAVFADEKAGPKLRFLRLVREWAAKADLPMPAAPPPPLPSPALPVPHDAVAQETRNASSGFSLFG